MTHASKSGWQVASLESPCARLRKACDWVCRTCRSACRCSSSQSVAPLPPRRTPASMWSPLCPGWPSLLRVLEPPFQTLIWKQSRERGLERERHRWPILPALFPDEPASRGPVSGTRCPGLDETDLYPSGLRLKITRQCRRKEMRLPPPHSMEAERNRRARGSCLRDQRVGTVVADDQP